MIIALAVALAVALICFAKLVHELLITCPPPSPVQYVVVDLPPFPRTFGEFLNYPMPLAVVDLWLQGGDPDGVATVYNAAGALARMNGSKFSALSPPTCPKSTR